MFIQCLRNSIQALLFIAIRPNRKDKLKILNMTIILLLYDNICVQVVGFLTQLGHCDSIVSMDLHSLIFYLIKYQKYPLYIIIVLFSCSDIIILFKINAYLN